MDQTYYFEPKRIMIRKGKISLYPGMLSVTSSAIVLEEKSKWAMMFGLIGVLMQKYFPGTVHTITPSEVASVQKTSFGVNKEVLDLTLTNGTVFTIVVQPHMEAIVAALMKLGIQVKPQAI